MTVNTLGSDSGLVEDSFGQGASRASRTVAELLWPFFSGCLALFSISALLYYHFHQAEIEPRSALQHAVTFVYRSIGLAPAVLFFLLVAVWSTIWFVTGTLQRPAARLGRLVMMAVMLGVFLNLGEGGVVQAVHKGAVGGWLADRMVAAVGYIPSLILVWTTTFAALLLATDFFFSESFERMRFATRSTESGVETAVTDHLRGLSGFSTSGAARSGATGKLVNGGAVAARAVRPAALGESSVADLDPAELEAEAERAAAAVADEFAAAVTVEVPRPDGDAQFEREDLDDDDGEDDEAGDPGEQPRRMTYQERRAARDQRRRRVALAELAQAAAAAAEAELDGTVDDSVGAGELDALLGAHEDDVAGDDVEALAEEADEAHEQSEQDQLEDEGDDLDAENVDAEDVDAEEIADEDDEYIEAEEDAEDFEQEVEAVADAADDEDSADGDEAEEDEEERAEESVHRAEVARARAEAQAASAIGDLDADEAEVPAEQGIEQPGVEPRALEQVFGDGVETSGQAAADEIEATDEGDAAAAREVELAADAEQSGDGEPTVSIPRPEQPPGHAMPTPPAVPERSGRQQRLFGTGADDDLVQEAIDVVVGARRATAALLQRKLRIDYELASELLAELAARGIVAFEGDASQGRVIGP